MRRLVAAAMVFATLAGCGTAADGADDGNGSTTSATSTGPPSSTSSTQDAAQPPVDPGSADDPCTGLELGDPIPISPVGDLVEISGAVLATDHEDGPSLWLHQDSGHQPTLTRVGLDGRVRQSVSLLDIAPFDWEDMAAAVDAEGQRHLFVGDIGDNRRARRRVEVVRFPEPDPEIEVVNAAEVIELSLPRGPVDAEALIVDPRTDDLVVITKAVSGRADVLVAPGAAWAPPGEPLAMVFAGELDLGLGHAVLAADVDPAGQVVGVRTPAEVRLWELGPNQAVIDALARPDHCRAPAPFDIFGEALALDDHGYVLTGEAADPTLIKASVG